MRLLHTHLFSSHSLSGFTNHNKYTHRFRKKRTYGFFKADPKVKQPKLKERIIALCLSAWCIAFFLRDLNPSSFTDASSAYRSFHRYAFFLFVFAVCLVCFVLICFVLFLSFFSVFLIIFCSFPFFVRSSVTFC